MAAESANLKNNVLNALTLLDGTGTPVTLALAYDGGDFNAADLDQFLNECMHIETRGKTKRLVWGKRKPPQLTFSTYVGNMVGSTAVAPGTPQEFLFGKGAYSANVSTHGTGTHTPMTVDIRLSKEGTNVGDGADETVTFEDCKAIGAFAESEDGDKITWSVICYGTVVQVHGTNTVNLTQIT